jgi:hypothetical protein
MIKNKMVSVSNAGFAFCRYSVAMLIWLSLLIKIKWLLAVIFVVMFFSAILKVKRAPLIVLFGLTLGKLFESQQEILDEKAMRFAHIFGSIFSLICLILLYFVNERVGWIAVLIFAIAKTVSALGFCPAAKLYGCTTGGQCCAFLKKND